jgi:hypothetical protein
MDSEHADRKEIRIALEAAKKLFKKLTKTEVTKKLLVYCNFDDANAFIGESLLAGLTAVIFCELLRLYQHKEEFLLRNEVAITGKIDETGKLFPVDEDGLRLKIEACNFSFIKFLIVPKEQEELCRKYIAELHPPANSAQLEIIGVTRIKEIFVNRKFTELHHVPVIKQTARKIWKARRPIAAVVFLILVLVIGKMLYGPIDKHPFDFKYEGEYLVIKNQFGETTDKINVGKITVDAIGSIRRTTSLFDLNSDGYDEVIWMQLLPNESYRVIYCKDIKKDTILWNYPLKKKLSIPLNPINDDNFNCSRIYSGDFDKDSIPEVILLSNHNGLFPGLIIKIDVPTGKELGYYLNMGQLQDMLITDLDEDGIKDIIVAGISNSLNSACLFVLDPRFIKGCSPHMPNSDPEGIPVGLEKFYIYIPRSIVGKAYLNFDYKNWNTANNLVIQNSSKSFKVTVSDCNGIDWNANFAITFNFNMKPIDFSTGDAYDVLTEKLFEEGKIDRIPDYKYFNEVYSKTIQYWDGNKFINEPTMNKRYKIALK